MIVAIQEEIANKFGGKQIAVVGYGTEGCSTVSFLLEAGIDPGNITICDGGNPKILKEHRDISTTLGDDYLENIETFDVIIRSPGVSPHQAGLRPHVDKITSQTQIFFDYFPGETVFVTGTKGKSTTVSLLDALFNESDLSHELVGNIGIPALELLKKDKLPEWAILELSSYQLDGVNISPTIGILTSLHHEHHIQRHGSKKAYFKAKIAAVENAEKKLIARNIEQADGVLAHDLLYTDPSKISLFGKLGDYRYENGEFYIKNESVGSDEKMKLIGEHNRYNACAVLGVADHLDIPIEKFFSALEKFKGLEHRLEKIGKYADITRYNDAISTTPESTIAAISTLGDDVTTIFLGGKDGQYDFSGLADTIKDSNIATIILFPDNGEKIKEALGEGYLYFSTNNMQEAVNFAAKNTPKGTSALLSCASPSYSLWKNFQEKGKLFKAAVKSL